jgi:hypothetical protein
MVSEGENAVVASRATAKSTTSTHRKLIHDFVFLMLNPTSFSDSRLGPARNDVAAFLGEAGPPSIGGDQPLKLTIWIDIVNNFRQNGTIT